ncbi:MAG: hypothetical protein EBS68_15430 [Rhodobacteraceae bacterium]|nr:hypothetical protein [Paracoccaceae bacterium]
MRFFEDCDGVTEARGFFATGVHCDIKGGHSGKLDLGIIFSARPCTAAGVFTTNDIKAAPVLFCQELLNIPNHSFHGVVANSGNANACTGNQGDLDTRKMASETARHLKVKPEEILVFSTGRIGVPLPMSRITCNGSVARSESAKSAITPRSPIESAAVNPAANRNGRRTCGHKTRPNHTRGPIPRLSAKVP